MNRYILDTTNYDKFPPQLRRQYPFKDGLYEKDLDMIECEVPRDVYQELAMHIAQLRGHEYRESYLPIGVSFPLPIGVVLTCVGEY